MKTIIPCALILGIAGTAALAITAIPAAAQIGISVNLGDVAVGYRDGYYDSGHRWHHWAHPNDWQTYSHAHPEHYHAYSHTHHH